MLGVGIETFSHGTATACVCSTTRLDLVSWNLGLKRDLNNLHTTSTKPPKLIAAGEEESFVIFIDFEASTPSQVAEEIKGLLDQEPRRGASRFVKQHGSSISVDLTDLSFAQHMLCLLVVEQ